MIFFMSKAAFSRARPEPPTEISASADKSSGSSAASLKHLWFSSNNRRRISAAPSLLRKHPVFKIPTIRATTASLLFSSFNPSSNRARSPRTASEVPARSSPSALSASCISAATAPARTASVQLPWNCTSSASELRMWWVAGLRGPDTAFTRTCISPQISLALLTIYMINLLPTLNKLNKKGKKRKLA